MKMFARFTSLALASLLALAPLSITPAVAQVPSVSYDAPAQFNTYRATKISLAPAASATDFLTISGASGVLVRVRKIDCTGVSTAAAAALVQAVKRSTADSAGTATTLTNVPLNASNVAATAVVKAYTANPTLGTAVGTVAAGLLQTTTLASNALAAPDLVFDFSNQQVVLNGTAQQLALNANAASFSAGASLECTVEWNEQ